MKELLGKYLILAVALILFASGCGPANSTPNSLTVTFRGNQCSYDGAMSVAAGEVSVTMVVKKMDLDAGLVVLTFDEGKTIEDLRALPANADQPRWSHRVGEAERHVHPGERYTFKFTVDTGPIYLVCFSGPPDASIGAIGPIEVTK